MDPATGYSANEGSFKMAYFGRSFHFKQLLNEGGSLGTGKRCGGLRKILGLFQNPLVFHKIRFGLFSNYRWN